MRMSNPIFMKNAFVKKSQKFGAKRVVTTDGASFPSRLEARRYEQLLLLQEAGLISDLKRQPKVLLTEAEIVYHPDFCYLEKGRLVYEETKGFETADWLIKKKLWRVYGPGPLRILKSGGGGSGIRMVEEVHPRAPGTPQSDLNRG